MGGTYSIQGRKYIIAAGDVVNDGVNLWIDAANSAEDAWLDPDAFSAYGRPAWRAYLNVNDEGVKRLRAANNALTEVREALYQVAGIYSKAETDTTDATRRRTHRPEIDDPRYG